MSMSMVMRLVLLMSSLFVEILQETVGRVPKNASFDPLTHCNP